MTMVVVVGGVMVIIVVSSLLAILLIRNRLLEMVIMAMAMGWDREGKGLAVFLHDGRPGGEVLHVQVI